MVHGVEITVEWNLLRRNATRYCNDSLFVPAFLYFMKRVARSMYRNEISCPFSCLGYRKLDRGTFVKFTAVRVGVN